MAKAVTKICFAGCHVELERHRRKDRGAVGTEGSGVWAGGVPSPENFCIFLFQNGEFLCMPAWISVWYFLPFRVMPQAVTKHMHVNWSKSAEIVFSDSRKRRSEEPPPPLLNK